MANAVRVSDAVRLQPFVGTYAGTTAAQNIHIGFKPNFIWAWNVTDGTTFYMWNSKDIVNIYTVITTAGPAQTAGVITQVDDGTTLGFALPASDNNCNKNNKTYYFIAI